MQSILKKTLIAAAIASAASANAATITGTATGVDVNGDTVVDSKDGAVIVSAQGLETLGYVEVGTGANDLGVTVKVGTDYQETDLLILTITGAKIKNTSAGGITLTRTGAVPVDDADGVAAATGAVAIGISENTVTFRPAAGTEFQQDTIFQVAGLQLTALDSSVTVSSAGKTVQGIDIDAGKATQIAQVANQFAVKATKLDREIDVENERKQFTTKNQEAGEGTTKDSLTLALSNVAERLSVTVATGAKFALEGDNLDFLLDKDGKLASASYLFTGLTETGSGDNATKLTGATLNAVATNAVAGNISLQLIADGKADTNAQVLQPQSFNASLTVPYSYDHDGVGATHGSTTGSVSFSNVAAGAWSLSGAMVNMPYMPYGAGITQVIYISNDGKVDGDIELSAFDDEGNTFGPIKLSVTAAPGSVTSLSPAISSALADEGYDFSGKLDITLVVNSPKGQVDVYGAYNVRGDRVTVPVIKQ